MFWSNAVTNTLGDIPKLDFSLIFHIKNMQSLNLSYSNFLQVISDQNLEVFCAKLKEANHLKYLGLASVMKEYVNVRKYKALLENIPECQSLNISYNVLLSAPIVDNVFFKVVKLKMTFANESNLIQFKYPSQSQEIDSRFLEIARCLVKDPLSLSVKSI